MLITFMMVPKMMMIMNRVEDGYGKTYLRIGDGFLVGYEISLLGVYWLRV